MICINWGMALSMLLSLNCLATDGTIEKEETSTHKRRPWSTIEKITGWDKQEIIDVTTLFTGAIVTTAAVMKSGSYILRGEWYKRPLPFLNLSSNVCPTLFFTQKALRLKELDVIESKFKAQKKQDLAFVTLTGFRGTGKSELAKDYGIRYGKKCFFSKKKLALYFNVQDGVSIQIKEMVLLHMQPPEPDILERPARRLFNTATAKYSEVLFIFDKVKNYHEITPFLESTSSPKKRILITTVNNDLFPEISQEQTFNLNEGLDKAVAINFIKEQTGDSEREHILKLVESVNGLPVALHQAVNYIRRLPGMTCKRYLEDLNEYPQKIFDVEDNIPSLSKEGSYYRGFSLAFDSINNSTAKSVMELISILSPTNIPVALLQETLSFPSQDIGLNELNQSGFIVFDVAQQQVSTHPCIQDVIRRRKGKQPLKDLVKKVLPVIIKKLEVFRNDPHALIKVRPYLPQAEEMVNLPLDIGLKPEEKVRILNLLANGYKKNEIDSKSEELLKQAKEVGEQNEFLSGSLEEQKLYADTLNDLGTLLMGKSIDLVTAEEYFRKALAIKIKVYPPNAMRPGNNSNPILHTTQLLAKLLSFTSEKRQEARSLFKELLMDADNNPEGIPSKNIKFKNRYHLAYCYIDSASLAKFEGDYEKAERELNYAVEVFNEKTFFSKGHQDLADVYIKLGQLYLLPEFQNLEKAKKHFMLAKDICDQFGTLGLSQYKRDIEEGLKEFITQ